MNLNDKAHAVRCGTIATTARVEPRLLTISDHVEPSRDLIRDRARHRVLLHLRDIRAAGNDNNVFDYLENGAPFSMMGAGQYAAETSVIAPSKTRGWRLARAA